MKQNLPSIFNAKLNDFLHRCSIVGIDASLVNHAARSTLTHLKGSPLEREGTSIAQEL